MIARTAVLLGATVAVLVPLWRNPWWQRRPARRRLLALAVVAAAASQAPPLTDAAAALAAAHMVQHLLLVTVAAPLAALAEPAPMLLGTLPPAWRRRLGRLRHRGRATISGRRGASRPGDALGVAGRRSSPVIAAWFCHTLVLWFWHAAGPYDAAIERSGLHLLEHASFAGTALWFWQAVLSRSARRRAPALALLATFAMALQSVFLSALLTFARSPWYSSYRYGTGRWGLDPLADQQLAGLLMWVPAGAVHLAAGLYVLHHWLGADDPAPTRPAAPWPAARS
ncbi:MAG: cytochrome c oxidase assembly protein [Acidimicrobiia bacterium]